MSNKKNGLTGLFKEAGRSSLSEGIKNIPQAAATIGGIALTMKGIDSGIDYAKEKMSKNKFGEIISHAKKKHPELKKVPDHELKEWMNSLHSISPNISTDKGLASTVLSTVNSYGGSMDLATAKLLSEIGHKSRRDGYDTSKDVDFAGRILERSASY